MFLRLLFCLSVAAFAETLTYTGFSDISQKAAEEEAAAGIAKQISATVTSTTSVSRGETRVGGKTELTKDMRVKNMVKSNLFLKGLRFSAEPRQGKTFVSKATLNLDDLTSAARLRLDNIQKKVSEKEDLALEAVKQKNYAKAGRLLREAETEARPYQSAVDEISYYIPVDESMVLKSRTAQIQSAMVDSLRGTTIVLLGNPLVVDGDKPIVFKVLATKNGKPVGQFPVYAEHNGRRLAEAFTDNAGTASFRIPSMLLLTEPYVIKVLPGVDLRFRNEAAFNVLSVDYTVNRKQCKYKLDCSEKAAICSEVIRKLNNALGLMVESENVSPIKMSVETAEIRAIKQLTSYEVSLTLKKDALTCSLTGTGVGKNEADGVRSAISKMNFASGCPIQKFCED